MAKVKKTQQQIIAENEKISDQILEDLRSKGGDNMNGEKRANEKLDSMMAKSNVKDAKYEIYKKALREDRVKDIFPKESIQSLRKMFDRYMKETGGRLK